MKKLLLTVLVIAALLCAMAVTASAEAQLPAECPHCKTAVTWEKIDETYAAEKTAISGGTSAATTKHYYLGFAGDSAEWVEKSVPRYVCIYMNGKTITAKSNRAFTVAGGTLSLIGEGTVLGRGFSSAGSNYGGVIRITENTTDNGHTLNVYGTTITTTAEEGRTAARGGVVYLTLGTLNLYSGAITGGNASDGGTLYISDTATANLYGGSIGGGTVSGYGGSVNIGSGGSFNVEGGNVLAGTADKNGGTVYHSGKSFTMSGGTLTGGNSNNAGGALYVLANCTFEMSGGKIAGGTATRLGPCVYIPDKAKIVLSGSASIEELKLNTYDPNRILVKGVVTGSVVFRGASGEAVDGRVIGIAADDADLHKANYQIYNTELYVIHEGSDVIISSVGYIDKVKTHIAYCEACGKDATWMSYSAIDYESATYIYSGHYYIDSEDTVCNWKQKFVVGSDHVCLDLRGKTLVGSSRAFDITKGVLNIMDTVGGGIVTASGPSNVESIYGGTFFVRGPSTLNIYGGKMTYTLPTDGRSYVSRGGVVYALGSVNVYGGEISGGAAKAGANIYIDADKTYVGQLGLYGGSVSTNVAVPGASTSGPCIASRGNVKISGNPQVKEILFTSNDYSPALSDRIVLEGKFTGNVTVNPSSYTSGMDFGVSVNTDLSEGKLLIADDKTAVMHAIAGELYGITGTPAALVRKTDGTAVSYETLTAALEAAGETDLVILLADAANAEVTKLIHMDLNGFDIAGVSGNGVLVCKDNQTDDYNVTDDNYGRISGSVTCTVVGVAGGAPVSDDSYLMITEADGISFHRVTLQITESVLRPANAGIYFNGAFLGDQKVAALVEKTGVILNAQEAPSLVNMETSSLYTVMDASTFNTAGTSCLLSGVMKTENNDDTNNVNAATDVYAAAYIQLADGTVMMGATTSTNLKEQVAAINTVWPYHTVNQKKSFMGMFYSFENVMRGEGWETSNAASISDRKTLFATTDYTPYLSPWTHDVVAEAKADGKVHYYFMAGEGLHISDSQTYKDKWGDAYLIVFPNGQTLLVDTGPLAYAPVLAKNLERMGITHLDALLITHPHSDHHNGAFSDSALLNVGLLETITVDHVYYRGGSDPENTTVDLAYRVSRDLGIPCDVMDKGDVLTFGDVRLECVWPLMGDGDSRISGGEEINNMSIVMRLDYGEHSSLLTGDLYVQGEKWMVERVDNSLLDVDFLKVPHHGYNTSSCIALLKAVSPELAMAVGRLPIPQKVYDRYEGLGIEFLDDRMYGYVEVVGAADGTLTYEPSRTPDGTVTNPDTGDEEILPDDSED